MKILIPLKQVPDSTVRVKVAPDGKQIATEGVTWSISPYFTVWLSEFQRLRLQYTHLDGNTRPDDQFFLQWTAVIGSHVHSFRDR